MYLRRFPLFWPWSAYISIHPPHFCPPSPLLREDSAEEAAVKPLQRPGGAGVGGGGDLHLMD